ncbi:hypothetical protein CEXT_398941 [Caerostris extrusa]|uniref:Uncharacterized protein n=1 Tax=Caerostris extrusa TaxID=172846 RepID=A0AAV4N1G1_CAEEX|nr:hypothetical protein CEXT_398941 [Caerostris extrusa]
MRLPLLWFRFPTAKISLRVVLLWVPPTANFDAEIEAIGQAVSKISTITAHNNVVSLLIAVLQSKLFLTSRLFTGSFIPHSYSPDCPLFSEGNFMDFNHLLLCSALRHKHFMVDNLNPADQYWAARRKLWSLNFFWPFGIKALEYHVHINRFQHTPEKVYVSWNQQNMRAMLYLMLGLLFAVLSYRRFHELLRDRALPKTVERSRHDSSRTRKRNHDSQTQMVQRGRMACRSLQVAMQSNCIQILNENGNIHTLHSISFFCFRKRMRRYFMNKDLAEKM